MKRILFFLSLMGGALLNAQTYSNGNLSTGNMTSNGVAAPAGYTWSELQSPNTSYGAAGYYSATANFRLADDFTVPALEQWNVTSVDVFAYQTGTTVFPFNELNVRLWDGSPQTGGAIIFGDTSNVLDVAGSGDSMMYRVAASAVGTTRRIWRLHANVAPVLQPGTYYLDYQVHTTNAGAAFLPPVTNVGEVAPAGANAEQYNGTVWAPLIDTGSATVQALPFIVTYTVTSLGTTETRQMDSRVVVYPNPVKDSFRLSLPAESISKATEVTVYDQSGKKVKTFPISESYDVSTLEKGMYLIKINDGSNIKATKLIKN